MFSLNDSLFLSIPSFPSASPIHHPLVRRIRLRIIFIHILWRILCVSAKPPANMMTTTNAIPIYSATRRSFQLPNTVCASVCVCSHSMLGIAHVADGVVAPAKYPPKASAFFVHGKAKNEKRNEMNSPQKSKRQAEGVCVSVSARACVRYRRDRN